MPAFLIRLIQRFPGALVGLWVVVCLLATAWALTGFNSQGLFDRLAGGDEPRIEGAESTEMRQLQEEHSPSAESVTLIVSDTDTTDPDVVQQLGQNLAPVTADLADLDGVDSVRSPFVVPEGPASEAAAPLFSDAGDGLVMTVTMADGATEAVQDNVTSMLQDVDLADVAGGASTVVTSTELIVDSIVNQVTVDLVVGEAIGIPVALVLMVFVFGGFLAAGMPIVGAVASITTAMAALLALTYFMTVESFILNVVTVMGLGLSIDYALLIVSRFREEIAKHPGGPPDRPAVSQAVQVAMKTAGRAVVYSGITVAICVATLLIMRPDLLRGIGAGAMVTVVLTILASITLVPALLMLLGRKMSQPSPIRKVPGIRSVAGKMADVTHEEGIFSRLARRVQRRPWTVFAVSLVLLAFLIAPALTMTMRSTSTDLVPDSSDQSAALEILQAGYPSLASGDIIVVADAAPEEMGPYIEQIQTIESVESVVPPSPMDEGFHQLGVVVDAEDIGGPEATAVTDEIRALDPDFGTWVGGEAGAQMDFNAALYDMLPWAAGLIAITVFVLLFLMTGSVVIPIKALIINVASLLASVGLTNAIFTSEFGANLVGFSEPVGGLEAYVVAIILAFGFGLAMDYEVFLLSRIKEAWDATSNNDLAVQRGLQRSGRIITAAAAIIVAVFLGFAFGELLPIKQVGIGLAITVTLDATVVRLLLVPATMTMLGKWNWWAPKFLKPAADRVAIRH